MTTDKEIDEVIAALRKSDTNVEKGEFDDMPAEWGIAVSPEMQKNVDDFNDVASGKKAY